MNFPDDVPTLTDGTVTLRGHHEGDVEGVYEQCVDPVSQQQTTVPVPYSRDDAREFVTAMVPGGWARDTWIFAVESLDEDGTPRFCGTVELRSEGERRAEIAYGAHPWGRGRGIMHRALDLLLEWGFAEKHLETVIWWANKGNWASRKLAWRLGFSFDGAVRAWLPQRGELLDAWVGSLRSTDERKPRNPWFQVPRIEGQNVVLRALEPGDLARVVEACSDERTAYWLGQMPHPYTLADAEVFLESRREMLAGGRGLHWVVADPVTDGLLANISVFDLKPGREAEIGYWTHPDARGRGVMSEACGLVVRHAFVPEEDGGLGLERLLIYAAEGNSASRRVIEGNGFVTVGRERCGTKLRDGSLVDTVCYDLLASEYGVRVTALRA
ncbi:MAG TPA: GNAT family N-acetyltransferase [Nocardioidaceae bacterium]|nr:GNAT family N-acetyltransferase [Nocardioidaceae bacterium]